MKSQTDRTNYFCKGEALLIKAKHALIGVFSGFIRTNSNSHNTHRHNSPGFAQTSSTARKQRSVKYMHIFPILFLRRPQTGTHVIFLPGPCMVCSNSCIAVGHCCSRKSIPRQMGGDPKSAIRQYIQFLSKSINILIKYYSSKSIK